jgi:hypothetical protein
VRGHATPQSIEIASTSAFPSVWLDGYLEKSPKELRSYSCIIGSEPDFAHAVGTSVNNKLCSQLRSGLGPKFLRVSCFSILKSLCIPVNRLYIMVV